MVTVWRLGALDVGSGLMLAATACSVGTFLLLLKMRGQPAWNDRFPRISAVLVFVCLSVALAIIAAAALSSDFSYRYVWEHSSADLDSVYKLSSVWAGGQGSLLVCVWLMSLILMAETTLLGKTRKLSQGFVSMFVAVLSLLIAFLSCTVLMSGMFARTTEYQLVTNPEGLGMDVLLQTPEMIAHAPLILGAYAAMAAVFAAAVAYHLTGEVSWYAVGLPLGRVAWLLLTAGIVLGAVWAYYVIGWGGYWSWDPIETSSLVPWFMITAFVHTQLSSARRSEYPVAAPLFGMMSFVGVVFVSFVVRAGGLWESSVHDYGASAESSAASRLVTLLQQDASLAGLLGFLASLVFVAAFLSIRAAKRVEVAPHTISRRRLHEYVNDQNATLLAVTLMAMSGVVAILLMLKNIESSQQQTYEELDQKMSVLFVALAVALSLCLTLRTTGAKRALTLSVTVVVVSIALALVGSISESMNGLVLFVLPSSGLAIIASVHWLLRALSKGSVRVRLFRAGAQMVHLGIALTLLSHIVASNLQSDPPEGTNVVVPLGHQIVVGDYAIQLVNLIDAEATTDGPTGVTHVRTAVVDIYEDGRVIAESVRLEVLYGEDPVLGLHVLESVAQVRSSAFEDLYMSFDWISEDFALMHVRVIPMMTFLWTGVAILICGFAVRFLTSVEVRTLD